MHPTPTLEPTMEWSGWGSIMTATTMRATNHDDQLGESYPTMLNELNGTFGVSHSRFHCCGGRHGHGLRPIWSQMYM